jgi:hypothetical protein
MYSRYMDVYRTWIKWSNFLTYLIFEISEWEQSKMETTFSYWLKKSPQIRKLEPNREYVVLFWNEARKPV